MKAQLVLFALVIVHASSLSYNWPQNPSHVFIIKPHLTALFGLQSYTTSGSALSASPPLLCESGSFNAINKIVLIERGNCTFYQKAMNAQRSGASGVIIADINIDSAPDAPLRMGYPTTDNPSAILIPVVSLGGSDFIAIQKLIVSSNGSVIITLDQSGFDGHPAHGSTGGGSNLPPSPNPTPAPHPTPAPGGDHPRPPSGGNDDRDHDGSSSSHGRSRSFAVNGLIISAVVVLSCLCGFCVGRRCGNRGLGARYCRRQQPVPAPVPAPAPSSSDRYMPVSVDMNDSSSQVAVAYYGEQEMAPVPSAPPQDHSSYPNSAPSNYA